VVNGIVLAQLVMQHLYWVHSLRMSRPRRAAEPATDED
jgi:hypothetical protein